MRVIVTPHAIARLLDVKPLGPFELQLLNHRLASIDSLHVDVFSIIADSQSDGYNGFVPHTSTMNILTTAPIQIFPSKSLLSQRFNLPGQIDGRRRIYYGLAELTGWPILDTVAPEQLLGEKLDIITLSRPSEVF